MGADGTDPPDAGALIGDALTAAALGAIDPAGLKGLVVHAWPGPSRDAVLDGLRALLPTGTPWLKLPAHVGSDRLTGGLDLAATLATGKPIRQPSLLEAASGGVLVIACAERLPVLSAALVTRHLDGAQPALVVACDESIDDEDRLYPALAERLAFHVRLPPGAPARPVLFDAPATVDDVIAVRQRLAHVVVPDAILESLAAACVALGIGSVRALMFANAAARAHAALQGRATATDDDAGVAARLVLAPRATQVPAPPADEQPDTGPDDARDHTDPGGDDEQRDERALDDVVLAAALAALPARLLDQIAKPARGGKSRGGSAGATAKSRLRGRPLGSRPGALEPGSRLDIVATLRAAAPWQPLRQRATSSDAGRRVLVARGDFHIRRHEEHRRTLMILAVDASGSAALERLGEAKGAVELILADCYVRRDQVALVSFRKTGAEVLLPPTRSLVRAKRALGDLPGGGATPLAAGIDAATTLATAAIRQGMSVTVVVLSDGRANVARDGRPGRETAEADALASGRALGASGAVAIYIDTATRPAPFGRALAAAMEARYLALPHADARTLAAGIRASAPSATSRALQ